MLMSVTFDDRPYVWRQEQRNLRQKPSERYIFGDALAPELSTSCRSLFHRCRRYKRLQPSCMPVESDEAEIDIAAQPSQ
jgi:hypothetical protein